MIVSVESRARRELVVAFLDLSVFTKDASHRADEEVAETADAYYERVADHAARGGGAVVKFIGDGALLVFSADAADRALGSLLELRHDVDSWLADRGWSSRLMVKAHCGEVIAGGYGPRGDKRFDVLGNVVNTAARLPRPFHVTPQFFRRLSAEGRARLKKHTAPMTYIPVGDRHG